MTNSAHTRAPAASGATSAADAWSIRLTEQELAWLEQRLPSLTRREREVVRELCAGGANEEMADRLYIALPTLRTHLMRINQKLGTRGKGDVVRYVIGSLLDSYRTSLHGRGRGGAL